MAEDPSSVWSTTYYADWDYFASMVRSLRLYLYEHHAIPTWNVMLCGGKPEVANPQSWAYSWPSMFAYALPPYPALLAAWATMTGAGVLALFCLLRRWGASRVGAWSATCLYAFNGYFGAHFNQGHVTFAFFHLVPVVCLCLDRLVAGDGDGRGRTADRAAAVGVSFAFFTAGLPHALFYFFPAVLLFLPIAWWRRWRRPPGPSPAEHRRRALRAVATAGAALAFGLWLSAYRLWPIAEWQLSHPRSEVLAEAHALSDVIANTWRFHFDYDDWKRRYFASAVWCAWEYNAFIGPASWAVLAAGALAGARRRRPGGDGTARPELAALGIACMAVGLNASLGNANPMSLTSVFAGLPLANGIRVFSRYQILTIFGMALLLAWAIEPLRQLWINRRARPALDALLFVSLCAPPAAQVVVLARAIRTESYEQSASRFADLLRSQPPTSADAPRLARQNYPNDDLVATHQTFLLDQGYWVADCYEPMTVGVPKVDAAPSAALSEPPPARLVRLDATGVELEYPAATRGEVALGLAATSATEFNAPVAIDSNRRVTLRAADLEGGRLLMREPPRREAQGAYASLAGLLACAWWLWRGRSGPSAGGTGEAGDA